MPTYSMRNMGLPLYRPDEQGGADDAAEDYLSKLAQSVLKKEQRPLVPPIASQSPSPPRPATPQAPAAPHREEKVPASGSQEWIRKIDFYDEQGNFLPGTILVFEDGSMGVFKERNAVKDYDIVYQLAETGRAIPQGMPLYTYSVEPVGRLSQPVLEQIIANNKWERDMIVFHLVKYKDRVHIPVQKGQREVAEAPEPNETLSSWTVPKLPGHEPRKTETPQEKPALIRGRKLTIAFGPSQKWEAVYWGKDELGHVVAHNTHEKWSLMHLDLNRFTDSIVFGEIVGQDVIGKMEKDFSRS